MSSYLPDDKRYDQIPYARCGRSGLKLPRISLGLWHNFGGVDPLENQRALLRRAFDLGITHFDLANNYGPPPGSAEENFGRLLHDDFRAHRDELVISTKAGYLMWDGPYGEWGSRKYLLASLDGSLRRMGLDYVDIFYSHRPDPETPIEETMSALADVGAGCIPFSPLAQGLLTNRYLRGIPADSRAARPSGFLRPEAITPAVLDKIRALDQVAQQRGATLAQLAVGWLLRRPEITT